MAQVIEGKPNIFELVTSTYDSEEIQALAPEEVLNPLIHILDKQIKALMCNVRELQDVDEDVMYILHLANAMDLLKLHLQFTVAVINSSSEKEIAMLKEGKFSLIKDKYEIVKTKDDMSPVPAKYSAAMMHDKIIAELETTLDKCFNKDKKGRVELVNKEENLARIRVTTGRFELCCTSYPVVATFPHDEIFRHEKSAPIWQELYKVATFKELVTKEEVSRTSKLFHLGVHLSHIIINNQIRNKSNPYVKSVVSLLSEIIYYGFQSAKIETQALLYLLKPDVNEAFKAWNLPEKPWIAKSFLLFAAMIGYDKRIFLPRLFPKITKETILKEYQDGTINKLNPVDPKELEAPDLGENKYSVIEDLFTESDEKVSVRILAHENLNLKNTNTTIFQYMGQKAKSWIPGAAEPELEETEDKAIVIHMHGGGFVAMTSATHRVYLTRWVKNLKLVHFSIDYRNAPEHKYPAAVDDVWQAYLWITNYATKILGIKYKKVILVGDSSGATLALSLMYRLIRAGLPTPHGCLLFYPAYIMDETVASPSYFESLDDVLLPYSLLRLIIEAYIEKDFKKQEDPFLSPLVVSDEILEKLPPVRIVSGSKDPLYDDNWRFLQRLLKLNLDVKMTVHAHLSHGYICHKLLKNYDFFQDEACELIQELISIEH